MPIHEPVYFCSIEVQSLTQEKGKLQLYCYELILFLLAFKEYELIIRTFFMKNLNNLEVLLIIKKY